MKKITKGIFAGVAACAVGFGALSISCKAVEVKGTADTAFADTKAPSVSIPSESLKVVEALQDSFRSISTGVLPSVVEIDITEKTNEITEMFLGEELADAIFSCPSSFGGYQKIDTAAFFA